MEAIIRGRKDRDPRFHCPQKKDAMGWEAPPSSSLPLASSVERASGIFPTPQSAISPYSSEEEDEECGVLSPVRQKRRHNGRLRSPEASPARR